MLVLPDAIAYEPLEIGAFSIARKSKLETEPDRTRLSPKTTSTMTEQANTKVRKPFQIREMRRSVAIEHHRHYGLKRLIHFRKHTADIGIAYTLSLSHYRREHYLNGRYLRRSQRN